jgi:hypothetical protein
MRLNVEALEGKSLLSGITPGLTASLVATPVGTTVDLHYTETNTSNHAISFAVGPGNDGFSASRNGKTVWISNSGVQPDFLELVTLKPGQSFTLDATWDGHSNSVSGTEGPAVTGSFKITNELDPAVSTTVVVAKAPPPLFPPKPPAHHAK